MTDLCKTANVLIINGRMPHYSNGNPTFKYISSSGHFAVRIQQCVEDLKANESKPSGIIINRATKHPNTGTATIDEFFEHFSLNVMTVDLKVA